MRLVFDTNGFVSAFEFGDLPRTALLLASAGLFELCISKPLQDELERVLEERFAYPQERIQQLRTRLSQVCTHADPVEHIDACSDPDDNRVLACAVAAQAAYLSPATPPSSASIRSEPYAL